MIISYFIVLSIISIPLIWYGLLLALSSKKATNPNSSFRDSVSLVIACYNEEDNVEYKIRQLTEECENLTATYEIIVISDGSTDNTNAVLERLSQEIGFQSYFLPIRKGKATALNLAVSKSKHPILLFSDTRQELLQGSVANLLKHFSDIEIGAVSSVLIHEGTKSILRESINKLKQIESQTGSTIGVYGGLYAVRKNCLTKLPEETILDDLQISLFVLTQGKRVIMEPLSVIHDISIENYYSKKKIFRTICGLLQILKDNRALIKNLSAQQLLFLYVQKYAKLSIPILMILLTFLSFDSSITLIFHFSMLFSCLLLLMSLNAKGLLLLIRVFGACLISIRSIKNYNTNLWEKTTLITSKSKLNQKAV